MRLAPEAFGRTWSAARANALRAIVSSAWPEPRASPSMAVRYRLLLPRRWVVERTIAWLNRCRRLAKDWECLSSNGLAFLRWASIRLTMRKLCKASV